MYHQGWEPLEKNQLTCDQAFDAGSQPAEGLSGPVRARKRHQAVPRNHPRRRPPHTPADLDLRVLIPAYILSELKAGFQIGAVLFLPFMVIDLVVASVTLSIGMVQLPPVMISAPFKILLVRAGGRMESGDRFADEEFLHLRGKMTPEFVVQIMRQALMMTFWLGAPLLVVGFLAGIA